MRQRFLLPKFRPAATAALAMLMCLSTAPAFAATYSAAAGRPAAGAGHATEPAPLGAVVVGTTAAAVQHGRLSPTQLPPPRPSAAKSPDRAKGAINYRSAAKNTAAQSCNASDFGSRTGSTLATYV